MKMAAAGRRKKKKKITKEGNAHAHHPWPSLLQQLPLFLVALAIADKILSSDDDTLFHFTALES